MNLSVLVNHRFPGESSVQFRERRQHMNGVLKQYLRYGKPATAPRKLFRAPHLKPVPMVYAPGPHPSHKPREVVSTVQVIP